MADKDRRFSFTVLAGDGLLLLCALLGLVGSFLSLYGGSEMWGVQISALNRCAGNGDLFFLCALLCALLSLGAFSLPRFRGAAVGTLTALWAGTALLCWKEAVRGAGITVREITVLFSRRVDWGRVFQYETGLTYLEETAAVRVFLLLLTAGLALLLGWAVVRARRWWVVMALTLPPLFPGLLADLYPDWPAFMALAACWCVMLLTGLCKWAAPSGRGKLTLTVFPAVALVLAAITLAFPREGYARPPWALKAQEDLMNLTSRMSEFFSRWDGPFQGTVTYVGAAEEADLAHAGPLRYTGRTVLRIRSDYGGWMYLRGSSLAVYEDGVWKALPEGTYEAYSSDDSPAVFPIYFPAMLEQDGSPVYTVTVNNVGAVGACVYTPYFLRPQDPEETGMLPVEDSYLARRQGQWEHTMTFVDRTPPTAADRIDTILDQIGVISSPDGVHAVAGVGSIVDGPAGNGMDSYSWFAYENYLDVPEELRETLEQTLLMWQTTRSDFSQGYQYAPAQLAKELGEFLGTFCEYDASAPAAPEGVDPVLYFLTESHRGYCMHYASAVTLMLRTMGIPARYVSGFAVGSVPDRYVDVPDRAAHAWVEVWVNGFGWYPVEVTPTAAFDWAEQGGLGPNDPSVDTPAPTSDPALEPTPEPTPTQGPDPSAALPGNGDNPNGPGQTGPAPALLGALKALGAGAGAALLLWLLQFLLKRLRAARMAGPEPNRAALVCYGYLCRLKRWDGRMDDRAVELAQKARFSQHTLTEEELALLRRLVDRERTRLCVAPSLPRRLIFRYLWGMPKPPVSLEDGQYSQNT